MPMREQKTERQVIVGVYTTPYEADIVWSLLEAFEIPVFPSDYYTIYIDWLYSNALGGIKLRVNEQDTVQAREVIAGAPILSSSPLAGEGGVRGDFQPYFTRPKMGDHYLAHLYATCLALDTPTMLVMRAHLAGIGH